MSSMGGAAAMSATAPSDVTGICGTGYYISVSSANCAAAAVVHVTAPVAAAIEGDML
jgi:hypothetical protein